MARSLEELPEELAVHLPRLLEAMVSVGSGLQLHNTLDRIVETAAGLTGARYAVIGVINDRGDALADLVSHGLSEAERDRIAALPDSETGILKVLVTDPAPLMLADLGADARRSTDFPPRSALLGDFLGVPVRVGEELFGSLYLAEKQDGGEFSVFDLHMMNVLATEAGIQIGNARLYEEARQRGRWIDGAAALTTALLSGAGGDARADDALAVVAEQGRRLAEAVAGIVLLPAEQGGLEVVQVSSGMPEALEGLGSVVAPSGPVYGRLLEGRPVFVDDAATDPRMVAPLAAPYGPSMMLPLQSDGRVLGTLVLPRLRGARGFTETERTLAVQFAAQAALALLLAEAQRDRERLAVYEDRDRIARDLHDLVIQRLFATGMMLEGAQRKAIIPEVRDGISRAVDEMDVTIQEIRTAIFALQQGPAEAPSGLRTRVEREVNAVSVLLGFRPSVRFTGPVDHLVGEQTARHLLAALREALSNAFRHAGASRVEVVVDATVKLPDGTDGVRLTVADDGVGLQATGRRSGLRNLEVRAESLGGSSRHGPGIGENGKGTRVTWEAPLRGRDRQDR
ncbi:sensor histidine kinase [Streptomyces meridianus]|uniref:GAF domain-containing protein n=1 Tax=Streptomyces meridianus TaxID=2938945 RepID=A0ABT0X7P4_9ACTN|nr:GAF domain-containing protein [Streptomyces meridianus]MCM2578543.1 GAF domain-containing protein [Streptomyces meridianus]